MTRLIDADALTDEVDKYIYRITGGSKRKLKVGESAIIADIKAHIELSPTIDAEPVRHGKWTVTPIYIKCSECGESFMLIPQNYCPNCGARMYDTVEEVRKQLKDMEQRREMDRKK